MSTSHAMPWRLVIAGCIGFFAATATGSTRAPFLPDMAADLQVSLPAIANLFGVTAGAWGISSYLAGRAANRFGRRVFLLFCPALLALAMIAVSQVQSYWSLVTAVAAAGVFCGAFTTSILAEVALRAHSSFHGRALGYVMSGQSLTLLLGVPLSAWLGAMIGWRGMHLALAALAAFAVVCMLLGLGRTAGESAPTETRGATLGAAMTGPVMRLFAALVVERVSFGMATFYYASYLRTTYQLAVDAVALPLVGYALGNIVGTIAGGQLADRLPYRRINFAVALITSGCLAVPWFALQSSVALTVSLGVLFAFFNALGRPSLLAALADVPADVRGVVMGMNSAIASIGWLTAALLGGWLYASVGFLAFGPLMALMCVAGALVVVPDSRIRQRHSDP